MTDQVVRLDARLHELYPAVSRAQLQKYIKTGYVSVNGSKISKPSLKISESDDIKLETPAKTESEASVTLDIPILYEDDDCVVINKPMGVLTHSKGATNTEATVATWLQSRADFNFSEPSERSGIVHRLDRATSGVMICAKNPEAQKHLQKQFQSRKAKKIYRTLVFGHLRQEHAILDLPIERNPKAPQKFRVGANGKAALTEYKVISRLEACDDVELRPTTGRTHQLRVHMNYLGHPIIGDTLYGGTKADRLYLHALSLEITLPSRQRETFTAPLPKGFSKELRI